MSGDPENRSESGSEEREHRHRQPANGIKNQRITKAQDRILNRMAKSTKRMPLDGYETIWKGYVALMHQSDAYQRLIHLAQEQGPDYVYKNLQRAGK